MERYQERLERNEINELMHSVESFTGTPHQWLEYCASLWNTDHGQVHRETALVLTIFRFTTGGWRDNELIIEAMEENPLWVQCWKSSNVQGEHCFIAVRDPE